MPVSTAMDTVYAAMLKADGSENVNFFTLRCDGTVQNGETLYDFSFAGSFDITQNNRENDTRSVLSFEVKQGGIEKLAFYYKEGKAYLHFPPYALSSEIRDFNLAEVVFDIYAEKKNGVIKHAGEFLPAIASRICNGCRYFSENGVDSYRFLLSYEQLFSSVTSLVTQADIGLTPADFSALFGFTSSEMEKLVSEEPETTITFFVSDGVFVSARAEKAGSGAITISRFSCKSGTEEIEMTPSLSAFKPFDPRNFSLSGRAKISTVVANGDKSVRYGTTVNSEFDAIEYPFLYDIKSNYVAGQGLEFTVKLTDPNDKDSLFAVRGDYLYVDLSDYGIAKFKTKTEDLSKKLGAAGFKDTDEFDFKDKIRFLTLLFSGRTTDRDKVTYTLGADFFDLFAEKIGFLGLFGVDGATFSWDTRNNRLQDLSASVTVGSITFSLTAPTFAFGLPVTLPAIEGESDFTDLTTRTSTRIKTAGTMGEQTAFKSDGEFFSALLSSLSGEEVNLSVSGGVSYASDFTYAANGDLSRALIELFASSGEEVVKLYFTDESKEQFYLIYPEEAGVRPVRTLTLAEEPLAAFNAMNGIVKATGGENRINLKARDDSFTIELNAAFISFMKERLQAVFPDLSLFWTDALAFRRIGVRMTKDAMNGTVVFNSDNEFYINATTFSVAFNESFSLLSLTAAAPARVELLAENDMPVFADASFTGDRNYKLSLFAFGTNDRIWEYSGIPTQTGLRGAETTVVASAALLGKTLVRTIKVDVSPATAVSLSGGSAYARKYDVTDRKFSFDFYNDVTPSTVLATYDLMIVDIESKSYVKDITWDTTGVSTKAENRNFTIRPRVKTYFGNEIYLGSVANFTLAFVGEKAISTDYTVTFAAYDGRDPLNEAVYSDVLNVRTSDGRRVTVERVAWDLTNANVEEKRAAGTLYEYKTNPYAPDKMKAKVYDTMGNYEVIEVPIFFEPKIVRDASFDVSDLDGVSYDSVNKRFMYDVLKVHTFTSSQSEKILPTALVANPGQADEFSIKGVKWEFETIEGIVNTAGATGFLNLIVGDSISGYQTKRFEYAFTPIQITEVALLDEEGETIVSKTSDMFTYEFTGLNSYTYRYPKSLKISFTTKNGSGSEIIPAKWEFDKAYRENELAAGGVYNGTGFAGSEKISLTLSFDQILITGYSFGTEDLKIGGKTIPLEDHQNKSCLSYAVLAALDPSVGFDYTSTESYPSKMQAFFNNGAGSFPVDVTWDLSAFDEKTDIIGNGFFGTVSAVAKGQIIPVYVYVAPAIGDHDEVYTKQDKSSKNVTFRLLTPAEHGFTVTDPRDVKNFPNKLYVESGLTSSFYPVSVVSWNIGDGITKMYTQGLAAGTSVNEISGSVGVTARIGNDKVGYKDILMEVSVVACPIQNITVSGLPFAASSDLTGGSSLYAIDVDYTAGAHGSAFSYDMSLNVNPYYVLPTSPASYPKYINFYLGGVFVQAEAAWDLSRIPADAALTGNTKTYNGEEGTFGFPTYAMIDLGSAFPNIAIGVEVNVIRRAIDKVWINGSSQPYIDIDGYAADPFGTDVSGSTVTMDVLVQFKGDSRKYPLKLKYDNSGVVLSFDGSEVINDVPVRVGNENGGYQTIEGYGLRVFSNIVSAITLSAADRLSGTDGKFFETTYESATSENLVYTYKPVMDMGKELPASLSIEFGMGAGVKTVYQYDPTVAQKGVVFKWVRNAEDSIGIELWNASVSAEVGGAHQSVFNATQSDFNSPRYEMFFGSDVWTEVFRDSEDEAGYITPSTAIAFYAPHISTARVSEEYQDRYVTIDEDNAPRLSESQRLSGGTYRLYVAIGTHAHYRGSVYKTFAITKKDVSAFVSMCVDGARHASGYSAIYRPSNPYILTAIAGDYEIEVPFVLNGESSQSVSDVRYNGANQEIAYSFNVSVDPANTDYTATAVVEFTVRELVISNAQDLIATVTWNSSTHTFDAVVLFKGAQLEPDAGLTNGYSIEYYRPNDTEHQVTSFVDGETYLYFVDVKIPNYTTAERHGNATAR